MAMNIALTTLHTWSAQTESFPKNDEIYQHTYPGFEIPNYDPETFPKHFHLCGKRKIIPDFLHLGPMPCLGMAPEAKSIIEALEPGVHEFFPVTISRKSGNQPILRTDGRVLDTPFYYCNVGCMLDAVWLERSRVSVHPGLIGGPPLVQLDLTGGRGYREPFSEVVLHREIVAGHHLWRGHFQFHRRIFISDQVAEEFRVRNFRGLDYYPVREE
ncbi:DUF1629 domain-containing protein [Roseomonas sp. CAU 1739]|uniref:imm11 family protein n=1 Tax=Roseomonas sp. CAU 1739 TaxID=3140364 RepID=UPI00325B4640